MFLEKSARLAQMVERTAFNRMVVGSSPTVGTFRYGLVVKDSWFSSSWPGFDSPYRNLTIIVETIK